ncbi:MAG: VOC family protein [Pseudonocardiaceae bacterium]|nr:VOC family protein [Pseudonocardiaceae bacterium]
MKIGITSVLVDDQEKAHQFYTDVLGFVTKEDAPVGDARWLTVTSPEGAEGVELLLEPDWNPDIQINGAPAAKVFKKTLVDAGIPWTSFGTDDIQKEYERLRERGVQFTMEPTQTGPVTTAIFDDTCGNLIMVAEI